jgi:DNA-binding NtrC family response regulator
VRTKVQEATQRPLTLDELEAEHISDVLEETRGNKNRAAQLLGIDRKTLYRKLQKYEREALRVVEG